MSRCFPFPPPGYEKKPVTDDADLLKKEKHREKKHKKEKKDKEKKEGKEKREKDRSDSKHKEKKDRKEKHRDKKEKEKDKDKDKKPAGQSETYNGEKSDQKERDPDKGSSSISNEKRLVQSGENHGRKSLLSDGAGDYKFVQELGRRIRDEEGTRSQMVQRFHGDEQKSNKQNQRADNLFGNDTGTLAEGKGKNEEKRFDHRKIDGQTSRGDPRSSGNAAAQNHTGMVQTSIRGMARPLEKNILSGNTVVQNNAGMVQNSIGGAGRPLEKNILSGNAVVQNPVGMSQNRFDRVARPLENSRPSGNAVVQNLSGMAQNSSGGMAKPPEKSVSSGSAGVQNLVGDSQIRGDGVGRPLEKKVETKMEVKEKSKEKEGDEKRGDKRKGKDREKKSHGKDKEREKDKKKEKGERKSKNPDKLKDRNRNNLPDPSIVRASDVSKNGDRTTTAEENLNKRKHSETNGFHETDARPNKVLRLPPHPSTENGRKLEAPESIYQFTSDKRGLPMSVDNKEHKTNGSMEAQALPVSSNTTRQGDRTPQASKKPPHPIPKNVSQLITIPKVEERSDFLDNKEHKAKNGLIQAQPLPVSSSKTSATTQADRVSKASKKPHPDSKYLSQVLSIPKMEEWSDFDDQEWLLCSKKSSDKTDAQSAMVVETPRVWAEALQIESADVCALPYVIPF